VTQFLPFKGIYYNNEKVRGDDVLAPPYDIISPEKKETLYSKSDHNIVRIDFGKDEEGDNDSANRYTRARKNLEDWLREDILLRHGDDAFYAYETEYRLAGARHILRGIIGALELVKLGEGVYPHEETHSAPKLDRLNIMRYCKANVSPIFSIYRSDKSGTAEVLRRIVSGPPYLEAADDQGDIHRMWIIDKKDDVAVIREEISGRPVFIADGHHRYETAFSYRNEVREKNGGFSQPGADHVMMFLADMNDPGIAILPTHRLVKGIPATVLEVLREHFEIISVKRPEDLVSEIAKYDRAIGMFLGSGGGAHVLLPREIDLEDIPETLRDLDVTVLHKLIFKKMFNTDIITYEMDHALCIEGVRGGRHDAAFFLNPTKVSDIERVALGGLRMPPKSTYFYPKLLTGFVINPFE